MKTIAKQNIIIYTRTCNFRQRYFLYAYLLLCSIILAHEQRVNNITLSIVPIPIWARDFRQPGDRQYKHS